MISYNFILIIVNRLIKTIYYKPVKITINALGLAKSSFNMIVCDHRFFVSIISNKSLLLHSKFWLSLCFFFGIKYRFSTTFYLKINSQTKQQKSTIKAYFWVFLNSKQNNEARILAITEFVYNNAKIVDFGHTLFELNCGYYCWMFYKEDVNPHSKSKLADKLLAELKKPIIVCKKNFYYNQKH